MSNITVQSRVSPELKKQADAIFAAMGMSTADAIRIFLQQVVNNGGLPFQPTARRPNADTREAMQEPRKWRWAGLQDDPRIIRRLARMTHVPDNPAIDETTREGIHERIHANAGRAAVRTARCRR